jgi:hypothetical protein
MSDETAKRLTGTYHLDMPALAEHLAALRSGLGQLAVRMDQLDQKKDFNVRLEALKAAHEHVATLPTQALNGGRYGDKALSGEALISQELRIANYLLGGGERRGD